MTALPDSPYKGLAAFEDSELDALLFFGREREIEAVAANVLASRLTVLYGPSGVGKSSLLHAGVARRLRELSGAPVVVHDSWAEDPAGGLIASVREECGQLGPTAGLVDTVAAAAQEMAASAGGKAAGARPEDRAPRAPGELHILLDQFEEYLLYHGAEGPLSAALPELLRRPGLRVNVLLAIRDDALAELDEFAGRIPELFGNLLRLDRLDRGAGHAAILGPLGRYGELAGERFTAEEALVEAVLDEASTETGVEAPYLQLVLERLWERERQNGSNELRLRTFREIGGSRAIVREHVHGALDRLPLAQQEVASRVVRQLVTPSGRKVSHEAGDLAEYAAVEPAQLRDLLEQLGRRRIVRGVNGTPGAPTRYEIFHDVLGPPILAWQHEHQLRSERERARRQRRRLRAIIAATSVALAIVAAIAAYALVERSNARSQAQHASGRELAARALAAIPTNPQASVRLALRAAQLSPGAESTSVLRAGLLAMREEKVIRLGGSIVAAAFAPRGKLLLTGSSDGKVALYSGRDTPVPALPRQPGLTKAVWSPDSRYFATGTEAGVASVWRPGIDTPLQALSTGAPIVALAFDHSALLVASGKHVRLLELGSGRMRTFGFPGGVVAAAIDPNGHEFAVAFRQGKSTTTELVSAASGRTIRRLPEGEIHSLAFSPDGRLLATGSNDLTGRLWDARTGKLLHVLPHSGYVVGERFSSDGRSLVTVSSDGGAYVWDVTTGQRQLLLVGASGPTTAAAFSPNGSEVAVASADRLARLYYSQDGRLLAPLAADSLAVTSVGFDPSGRTLVTGSADGTVRLWSALPAGTLTTIDRRKTPVHSLWAGSKPVSAAGNTVKILTTSGRHARMLKMPAVITAASASGSTMAFLDRSGDLLIDRSGIVARYRNLDAAAAAIAVASNGRVLVAWKGGDIGYYNGSHFLAHVSPTPLELSAGGSRFLVRTAKSVRVYTDDGKLLSTIHTTTQHAVLSPGGLGVATTQGNTAQLWDATTGALRHTLGGHTSEVTDAEFSPNGLYLVTTSFDHTGLVYSTRTGRLIRRLIGHFFPVYSGSYSPDGHWIVTASQFTAGLWNAGNGQLTFYVGRHAAPLTSASFSPSGDWILTGSKDGTARVYHCEICEPFPRLERLAKKRLAGLG